MALWASGPPAVTRSRPYTGASNAVAPACAFVYRAKMAVIASAEPLNFGLYRTGTKGFVSATEYGQICPGDPCEGSKGGLLISGDGQSSGSNIVHFPDGVDAIILINCVQPANIQDLMTRAWVEARK